MKKIIPFLLFTFLSSEAQIIDAIAIDVEGEAITILEIQAVQEKLKMSKSAAVEALIKDRLEVSAIKKANIVVSPQEIQAKIIAIASSKGLTQEKMKEAYEKSGLTWESFVQQVSKEITKEHFYKEYIASSIEQPTESELKNYYETHRDKFNSGARQMSLTIYVSPSIEKLSEAIKNPMRPVPEVQKKNILASTNEMSPELLKLIENTTENSFTPPVNTGRGFVSYYIKSKGTQQSGFTAVKNTVMGVWLQEQRVQAGQDFFNKLKANANIRVIRL